MHYKEKNEIDLKGKTITFYSYKGGVGRSMSLVNIACLMAKQQKKVLLIDWDLEAPGLHTFFNNSIDKEALGLVDLITKVNAFIKLSANNTDVGYGQFLNENLSDYIIKNLTIENSNLQIDIIKAGKFDTEYSNKLKVIDWISLYKDAPAFFRTFAQYLEKNYDYILVDSRTGLADTSGVCTMLMPQILVLVFALNNQNINGVLDVAQQSVDYRFDSNDFRKLTILPLPSRIDDDNAPELAKWIKIYKDKFEDLFKDLYLLDECELENYFNIAKIPYKPIYAYGENIPVLIESTNNDSFISCHYSRFLKLIEETTPIWDILSSEQLEENIKQANMYYQKGVEYFYDKNYEKASLEFEKLCELDSSSATAFNNWGTAILDLAKLKNDEVLYSKSIEKYQKAIELNPKNDLPFNNLGSAITNLAILKKDESLYSMSFDKYQKATELNPNYETAFYNWGTALSLLAKLKNDETLYGQSFEKYQKATELNPDNCSAFYNWGNSILDLAILKNDESLFELSFEKFKKATDLNPEKDSAFCNWGNAISKLAKLKNDESLFKLSIEKFQKAFELNPNDKKVLNDWGMALSYLAKLKNDEELYEQSFEKLNESVKFGGSSYNLACAYAIKNNKTKALDILAKCLREEEEVAVIVKTDSDWEAFWDDADFVELM